MKRFLLVVALVVLVVPTMATAQPKLGFGASGGLTYPVLQDDQGSGTVFGARGILALMPGLALEANINFAQNGDAEIDDPFVTSDLEGFQITSYGVDATLGASTGQMGIKPYLFAGVGFYNASRDQTGDMEDLGTDMGFAGGLGIGLGVAPQIVIDVKAKANLIPLEGGSSRKDLWLMAGVNFFLSAK